MSAAAEQARPVAAGGDATYAVEMRHITKRWPGVLANDDVSLQVRKGQIHALVGENGAGKSTLMNILYGLLKPDSGEILVNGAPAKIGGPRDAIARGIGMVHQHFMLIPVLTVGENIVLGRCTHASPPRLYVSVTVGSLLATPLLGAGRVGQAVSRRRRAATDKARQDDQR